MIKNYKESLKYFIFQLDAKKTKFILTFKVKFTRHYQFD